MFGLTDDELATILTIISQNDIQKCILFGSRVEDTKRSLLINLQP